MFEFFPYWLNELITKFYNFKSITEIRIRLNKPIQIESRGETTFLREQGGINSNYVYASSDLISHIITFATKQSLYAFNDQIKHCYITTEKGIRIGVCGTVIYNGEKVSTIKNICSLNIRIAHQVLNCSEKIINFLCFNGQVKNTLIISPPGAGKTTLIRDLAKKLSNEKNIKNILVVDERFEIAGNCFDGFDLGVSTDIISGSEKAFAFNESLKTMSPKVIITDELSTETDASAVMQAISSGVKVIATAHAENIQDLKRKKIFEKMISEKFFSRIVVLSFRNGVGTVDGIFDENLHVIYIPYLSWK